MSYPREIFYLEMFLIWPDGPFNLQESLLLWKKDIILYIMLFHEK